MDTAYNYVRPVTSYSAYAEIVMLNTEQTAGNPDALDAQFLLQRLVPPGRSRNGQRASTPEKLISTADCR